MLTLPVWKLKKAEAGLSINSLQGLLRLQKRLRHHRLQQPPALLIGLAELLLQLVAECHQVGPNSGKKNSHIRFCHQWVADLG